MPKSLFAAASALCCLLCACSRTHTFSTKDGGSVSVESKGGNDSSMHVTGKDGTSVDINTGKLITDYPSDTPLYPGKSMMDMKSEQKHSRAVAVQSTDSLDKITAFYKSELDGKGWKTDSSMQTAQMNIFTASKDGRKLVISISSDGKLQTVSQQLADQ